MRPAISGRFSFGHASITRATPSDHSPPMPLVLLAISAGAFALSVWGINVETLPTDIFPAERVAAGVGLCGLLGTLGGVVFTAVTGYVVQHYSYTPIWIASAVMYPLGWLAAWKLMPPRVASPAAAPA